MATLSALFHRASEALSPINSKDLNLHLIKAKNSHRRPNLHTPVLRHLHSYGPEVNLLIDPPSSEENSGDEGPDTTYEAAVEQMMDSCLLRFKAAEPTMVLAVANLDPGLALRTVKKRLMTSSAGIRRVAPTEVHLDSGTAQCAVVITHSILEGDCQAAEELHRSLTRKRDRGELAGFLHGIRGLRKKIPIYWCEYEPLDQSKQWAAVVLRNLPMTATQETLRQVTAPFQIPIKRIEKPRLLHGQSLCSLLVVEDLEKAEMLCLKLHHFQVDGRQVKAHVHPDSRLIRPPDSHHSIFNVGMRKRAKKLVDAEVPAESPTTATPGVDLPCASDLDPCPVLVGPWLHEFHGESYMKALGSFKHAGADVVYKA